MLPLLVFIGALVCLGNLLGLGLFALAYRRQAARQAERLNQTRDDFQEAINQLLDRYQDLREQTHAHELPASPAEASPPHHDFEPILATTPATLHLQGGMNLTKRVQILRSHRRGENSAQIAATLGVPRAEVDLVVKLSGMHAAQ
jgi:hypothetical protein